MLLQLASNRFAAGDYDDAWQYVRVVEGVHPVVENTTVNLGESEEEKQFLESVIFEAGILPDSPLRSETDRIESIDQLWNASTIHTGYDF